MRLYVLFIAVRSGHIVLIVWVLVFIEIAIVLVLKNKSIYVCFWNYFLEPNVAIIQQTESPAAAFDLFLFSAAECSFIRSPRNRFIHICGGWVIKVDRRLPSAGRAAECGALWYRIRSTSLGKNPLVSTDTMYHADVPRNKKKIS